ncbi:MAG: hypothetical protein ACMUJM_17560 [bacterium]
MMKQERKKMVCILIFLSVLLLTGSCGKIEDTSGEINDPFSTARLEGRWNLSLSSGSDYALLFDNAGILSLTGESNDIESGSGSVNEEGIVSITLTFSSGHVYILSGTMDERKEAMEGEFTIDEVSGGLWNASKLCYPCSTVYLEGLWSFFWSSQEESEFLFTEEGTMDLINNTEVEMGFGAIEEDGTVMITLIYYSGESALLTGTMAASKEQMSGIFAINGQNAGTWESIRNN